MLQAPASTPPRSSLRPSVRAPSERPEAGIRVEDVGHIRKVTIDRQSKKNAISLPMYRALTAAFAEAAENDAVRVVLVSSSGGPFSAGSELGDFWDASPSDAERAEFAKAAVEFVRTLGAFPKPIIGAVGGLAVGMGATILLNCDLVVAARTAAFEFSFAKVAPEPEAGSSVLLAARVGLQRASEWLLFGERIDAQTALDSGLVNALVHREELAGAALVRAEALAKLPKEVVVDRKRRLRLALRATLQQVAEQDIEKPNR